MFAIFKRELKSYFDNVIGFIFVAVMIFISSLYISYYNLYGCVADMSYSLMSTVVFMILCVSILSMRVMAEERKAKTDQLLLTTPVSVSKIVVGKFLALVSVLLIVTTFLCIIPIYLNQSKFGEDVVPMKQSYVGILAYFLYVAACMAIGMFVSSLCESQVISAVLTFGVLFVSYFMENIVGALPNSLEKFGEILRVLCMSTRYIDMIQGALDLTAVLYFVTIIVIMNYLTVQSIQKRRYSVSVKNLSLSSYNFVMIIAVIAIGVVANMAVNLLPVKYTKIDVTNNKIFTLSDETVEYAKKLDKKVKIYVTVNEEDADQFVVETLESVCDLSDNLSFEYVDLNKEPKFYTNYTDNPEDITIHDLILECGDMSKIIKYDNLYEKGYDETTYTEALTGYDAEGQIISGIDYVTGGKMPKVYCLKGHSEKELESAFIDVLEKANIEVESLTLLNSESVPTDAACVLINYPTSDLSKDDLDKLAKYISAGGNMYINCPNANLANFNKLLAYYGIKVNEKIIFETDEDFYFQYPYYLIPTIEETEYTSNMEGKYVFSPQNYELFADTEKAGITPFMSTSDKAVAYGFDKEGQLDAENVTDGPFALGIASKIAVGDTNSTAIILASEGIFTNSADEMVSNGNQKLFKDTIYSIIPEAAGKISIPVKELDSDYLTVTESDVNLFRIIVVYLIPIAIMVFGVIIWVIRRRR